MLHEKPTVQYRKYEKQKRRRTSASISLKSYLADVLRLRRLGRMLNFQNVGIVLKIRETSLDILQSRAIVSLNKISSYIL